MLVAGISGFAGVGCVVSLPVAGESGVLQLIDPPGWDCSSVVVRRKQCASCMRDIGHEQADSILTYNGERYNIDHAPASLTLAMHHVSNTCRTTLSLVMTSRRYLQTIGLAPYH